MKNDDESEKSILQVLDTNKKWEESLNEIFKEEHNWQFVLSFFLASSSTSNNIV